MSMEGFAAGSAGLGGARVPAGSRDAAKRGGGKAMATSSPLVSLFLETADMELPVDWQGRPSVLNVVPGQS